MLQQWPVRSPLSAGIAVLVDITQIKEEESIIESYSSSSSAENPPPLPDEKMILKHINGYATSGQMTAILGARWCWRQTLTCSGAGKTTLLSILCGRNTGYTGTFRINGREVNDSSLR